MARAEGSDVIGWIEVAPAGAGKVVVTGHAYAVVATEGKFSLSLERRTKGNSAKTGQSGNFKAAAGENAKLSSTGINVEPGEDLVIELRLTVEGRDIAPVDLRTTPETR
ncbi:MAG: curli-like amyloid fiber formation chaperone CsgH [Hyphomicrobium sp.]